MICCTSILKERLLFSCQGGKQVNETAAEALATPAVYLGTLPCADCAGIEVSLTLDQHRQATYVCEYLGNDSSFVEKGTYELEDSTLRVNLPHDTLRFAVDSARLTLLAADGTANRGALAEHYVLHRRAAYDYVGHYALPDEGGGYAQTLDIQPEGEGFCVTFSASAVKGKANCSFSEKGTLRNDTLFVALGQPHKGVTMCVVPSHDQLGVEGITAKFEDRHALMWYCGGASLAGTYYKATVDAHRLGDVTDRLTQQELFDRVPAAQREYQEEQGEFAEDIYDNYTILTRDHLPLFSVSPKKRGDSKQCVNRVCVLNALYRTDKGIHWRSTFGELRKAYKIMRVEPDKAQIVVVVDEIRADFSIAKSKFLPGWWNEKTKSVDLSRVPDTEGVDNFILWWE